MADRTSRLCRRGCGLCRRDAVGCTDGAAGLGKGDSAEGQEDGLSEQCPREGQRELQSGGLRRVVIGHGAGLRSHVEDTFEHSVDGEVDVLFPDQVPEIGVQLDDLTANRQVR